MTEQQYIEQSFLVVQLGSTRASLSNMIATGHMRLLTLIKIQYN